MDPMIEKMFNDNLLNFKIIVELVDYLRVKYGEEPSFTFACFKNGLNTEQTEDLLIFYSDITDEIATEDIHLLDRNLLIEKTKEKIPNLIDDNKIGEIVESYINCCFLLKDK